MPWCDLCSQYHAPSALNEEQNCPDCGGPVEAAATDEDRTVGQSAPWHFWVVVAALAGYLLWRVIDGIIWALS